MVMFCIFTMCCVGFLFFFPPLSGTITSSSPTAQPAEVLLQATPPHRRARSAAWSYIFLPEEAWCDLTIHLPAAVLLKELHIQPHLASLASETHTHTLSKMIVFL